MKANRLSSAMMSFIMLLVMSFLALPSAAQEKNIVVHIGQFSNDLHSVTMGLSVANNLQAEGAQVTVFLDREGVRLADKSQKALIYADSDAEQLYTKFVEAGGKVLVCPHCAELAGVGKEALRKGSKMGTKASIAQMLLAADLVIDY